MIVENINGMFPGQQLGGGGCDKFSEPGSLFSVVPFHDLSIDAYDTNF